MFEKNVGSIDRVIRFVLGIALLITGIVLITGGTIALGIILTVVSLILVVTGLLSTCPLYSLFNLSTCPSKA